VKTRGRLHETTTWNLAINSCMLLYCRWVYECARRGKKLDEGDFSVDAPKPSLTHAPELVNETKSGDVSVKTALAGESVGACRG